MRLITTAMLASQVIQHRRSLLQTPTDSILETKTRGQRVKDRTDPMRSYDHNKLFGSILGPG
jgi:hypothetical protein